MSLRPYKFQVIAVCQRVEDDEVSGEEIVAGEEGQPLVVFGGVDGLHAFADGFEERLAAAEAAQNGNAKSVS